MRASDRTGGRQRSAPLPYAHPAMRILRHRCLVWRSAWSGSPVSCFGRRFLAPDDPGGSSGHEVSPKGVSLPGLAGCRQLLGLSQAERAARSGVSEKTIIRLERGGAHSSTLERLARALRVSRQWLLQPSP